MEFEMVSRLPATILTRSTEIGFAGVARPDERRALIARLAR